MNNAKKVKKEDKKVENQENYNAFIEPCFNKTIKERVEELKTTGHSKSKGVKCGNQCTKENCSFRKYKENLCIFHCDKKDWYKDNEKGERDWSKSEKEIKSFWWNIRKNKIKKGDYNFSNYIFPRLPKRDEAVEESNGDFIKKYHNWKKKENSDNQNVNNRENVNFTKEEKEKFLVMDKEPWQHNEWNGQNTFFEIYQNKFFINADFSNAVFLDIISFNKIIFEWNVSFKEVVFKKNISFRDCKFNGKFAIKAKSKYEIKINNCKFENQVIINSKDSQKLIFSNNKISDKNKRSNEGKESENSKEPEKVFEYLNFEHNSEKSSFYGNDIGENYEKTIVNGIFHKDDHISILMKKNTIFADVDFSNIEDFYPYKEKIKDMDFNNCKFLNNDNKLETEINTLEKIKAKEMGKKKRILKIKEALENDNLKEFSKIAKKDDWQDYKSVFESLKSKLKKEKEKEKEEAEKKIEELAINNLIISKTLSNLEGLYRTFLKYFSDRGEIAEAAKYLVGVMRVGEKRTEYKYNEKARIWKEKQKNKVTKKDKNREKDNKQEEAKKEKNNFTKQLGKIETDKAEEKEFLYAEVKKYFDDLTIYSKAEEFYKKEFKEKLKQEETKNETDWKVRRLFSWLWWYGVISDFNTNPTKAFKWIILVILSFAFIYFSMDMLLWHFTIQPSFENFLNNLEYFEKSLTSTIPFLSNDNFIWEKENFLVRILHYSQIIISVIIWSMLVLSLRRKFKR